MISRSSPDLRSGSVFRSVESNPVSQGKRSGLAEGQTPELFSRREEDRLKLLVKEGEKLDGNSLQIAQAMLSRVNLKAPSGNARRGTMPSQRLSRPQS